MPKTTCPACHSPVTYSRDAEPGTEVTCPECDEVFVPPELRAGAKKKAYRVEDEETYKAERAIDDPDRERKSRVAIGAARQAARDERERMRSRRKAWFEGPELWFLIFAVGAGGGLPFGLWLSRNWEKMGAAKFFWVMVALVAVMLAAVGLGGSAWAWLRRNRE